MSLSDLCRQEFPDYLFLARRGWCGLFGFPAIYEKDSYANLCWTACRAVPSGPAIALLLHVDKCVEGQPWGSVTLLDYRAVAEDVEIFASLPPAQRERHIKLILRRYLRNPRYCCVREVIEYLKTGGESQWM